jgi:hypothetical protein
MAATDRTPSPATTPAMSSTADCGDGAADTAHVDAIDPASAGCEQVVVGS